MSPVVGDSPQPGLPVSPQRNTRGRPPRKENHGEVILIMCVCNVLVTFVVYGTM